MNQGTTAGTRIIVVRNIPSEATIQAELYCALKEAGLSALLEQVLVIPGTTRTGRPAKIRVDVLVTDADGYALAAIEVKNLSKPRQTHEFSHTRQSEKYALLGIPFRYCTTMQEIGAAVDWAKAAYPRSHPPPLHP